MADWIRLSNLMGWLCFGLALFTALSVAWAGLGMLFFTGMFYALALGFYGIRQDEERAQRWARKLAGAVS